MTAEPRPSRRDAWDAVVAVLALDQVAAQVCDALRAAQIPAAVLKGPVLARELYDGDARRTYRDIDLLVPRRYEQATYAVMRELGFVAATGTGSVDPGVADEHQWLRDGAIVELHVTLTGIGLDCAAVWDTLAPHLVSGRIGGADVLVLDRIGLALHVALHAAQHGPQWGKPLRDLDLALARWPAATWRQAAALAGSLDAASAFEAGLRLRPAGGALADGLGLHSTPDVGTALRASSAPDAAHGLARMLQRNGLRGKLTYLLHAAFPSVSFMRWWSPLARRGRLGLAAAYTHRLGWLALHAPRALLAYSRARRAARDR